MAKFNYTAKAPDGRTVKGLIEAQSKSDAIHSLRQKNLVIVTLAEEKRGGFSLSGFSFEKKKKISIDDVVVFSRQFATMVGAGIPMVGALDILSEQIEHPYFRQVISTINKDIETGSSLSEALAKHPRAFSGLYVNMVKAGESSGMLDEILDRLASYLEKTSNLQRKVKSALIYPIAVTIMAILITGFLMIKIIPVFQEIYEGFGAELPTPTAILISVSNFTRRYVYLVAGFLFAACFFLRRYIKTEKGRLVFDKFKLKMPIFGVLMQKVAVGKFTRTLSTLVKSGVPILNSLEIVGKTSGNALVEKAIDRVRINVKEGEAIAEPLARCGVFPPMVVRMIAVGEQTGELEKMLTKISDFYDEQVDIAVAGLTSMIEPLIIAFLGLVIGGIVVCMFLPIFKITALVSR